MFSTSHLHPMLVHFPIALVAFGFVLEMASFFFKKELCLSKAGLYLLVAGTLSAVGALSSGILFTSEMSGSAGEVKEMHELFAWITVVLLLATSSLRILMLIKKIESVNLNRLIISLYGLSAVFVSITGFFGGTLVYNYMMPL